MDAGSRLFLLGNLVWMLATAGLLYEAAEPRLYVNYLRDEQVWAGRLLVGLSAVLTVGLALIAVGSCRRDPLL